jgi:hypothetical protein
MAVKSYKRVSDDSPTMRLVNVTDEGPDELNAGDLIIDYFDVDRFIDSSSSTTTLAHLSAQGYSSVKVLDRAKVKQLIRQAVNEAIKDRAAGMIEQERLRIEEESRKRFEQLVAQGAQAPATLSISDELPKLSSQIAGAVRAELTGVAAIERLDAIEEKMQKLLSMLETVERTAGRLGVGSSRHVQTGSEPALDDLRKAVLEEIFKTNLELRTMKAE